MLSTFLDKAGTFFDRRFLVAYWSPVLLAAGLGLLVRVLVIGPAAVWRWWGQLSAGTEESVLAAQVWLLLAALLAVTLAAYLLQPFTRLLVRLFEGYWPAGLRARAAARVQRKWQALAQARTQAAAQDDRPAYATLQDALHHLYPPRADRLLPTRLGNVLRSAEDYPVTSYGMDAVFWWPRLWPLVPAAMQTTIGEALTPLLALLNLAALLALTAVDAAVYLARVGPGAWAVVVALAAGALLSWLSYSAAVAQARGYGVQVRAAVDLYRFDLLQALHQKLPAGPEDERVLWAELAAWLYNADRGAVRNLIYEHAPSAGAEES